MRRDWEQSMSRPDDTVLRQLCLYGHCTEHVRKFAKIYVCSCRQFTNFFVEANYCQHSTHNAFKLCAPQFIHMWVKVSCLFYNSWRDFLESCLIKVLLFNEVNLEGLMMCTQNVKIWLEQSPESWKFFCVVCIRKCLQNIFARGTIGRVLWKLWPNGFNSRNAFTNQRLSTSIILFCAYPPICCEFIKSSLLKVNGMTSRLVSDCEQFMTSVIAVSPRRLLRNNPCREQTNAVRRILPVVVHRLETISEWNMHDWMPTRRLMSIKSLLKCLQLQRMKAANPAPVALPLNPTGDTALPVWPPNATAGFSSVCLTLFFYLSILLQHVCVYICAYLQTLDSERSRLLLWFLHARTAAPICLHLSCVVDFAGSWCSRSRVKTFISVPKVMFTSC